MNAYAKQMMFKANLNLWNEKSKLGHFVYEIALLCFKCLHYRFYESKLMKLGYGLALNEACIAMRCISHSICADHMPKFWVVTCFDLKTSYLVFL